MNKQQLQILRILENKEFLQSYSDIELHIERINKHLPLGYKIKNSEINLCDLSTLNDYSIKVLYGLWEMEIKKFIDWSKDAEYKPEF